MTWPVRLRRPSVVGAQGSPVAVLVAVMRASGMAAPYDWADLRVPCIIGYGASWPHVETSPQLARTLACPTFTIEEASHVAHLTHPAEFAEFVRRAAAVA